MSWASKNVSQLCPANHSGFCHVAQTKALLPAVQDSGHPLYNTTDLPQLVTRMMNPAQAPRQAAHQAG